jgi:2',3'-cyclic-nucleotide 2'-phosphodiesterase (5'-nucleotidase family)
MSLASPRRNPWRYLAGGALLLALAAAGAWWAFVPAGADGRPLVVVVSGDTAGWLVPCDCTSNQSGGLPRRGTYVNGLRRRAEVVLADAGGAPGGTSAYHRAKFEAILRGELAMGLSAHNLGGPEAALGTEYLRKLGGELSVPFVSANLRDRGGEPVAVALRVVERGGQRLAITGVLSRRYEAEGVRVDEPREALLKVIGSARGRYDRLVVLAYLPEEELRQLAAGLPEADAVVGGPTGQSIAPQPSGPTLLAAATNKGKFLVKLDVPALGSAERWTGSVAEMGPALADDADQRENLRRYLADLGRRDFTPAEAGLAPPLPPGQPVARGQAGRQRGLRRLPPGGLQGVGGVQTRPRLGDVVGPRLPRGPLLPAVPHERLRSAGRLRVADAQPALVRRGV